MVCTFLCDFKHFEYIQYVTLVPGTSEQWATGVMLTCSYCNSVPPPHFILQLNLKANLEAPEPQCKIWVYNGTSNLVRSNQARSNQLG